MEEHLDSITQINFNIPDYPGYKISRNGQVVGKRGFILKWNITEKGYGSVILHKKGGIKSFKIHQLVAIVFLNHKPNGNKIVVDHIDNNKLNNNVKNLQLLSNRENYVKNRKGKLPIGVYKNSHASTYYSRININGKDIYLGRFKTIDECNSAYLKALNYG